MEIQAEYDVIATKSGAVTLFSNEKLNDITSQIFAISNDYASLVTQIKSLTKNAFLKRWMLGKIFHENKELIIQECSSVRDFCKMTGYSENVFSNNYRGYKFLLEEGCVSEEDVLELLTSRSIDANSYNFERIGRILAQPDEQEGKSASRTEKQSETVQRKLEDITHELEDIRENYLSSKLASVDVNKHDIEEELESLYQYSNDLARAFAIRNPEREEFTSKAYSEFIRNYPYDVVTGDPVTGRADPHHANEFFARQGGKITDLFQIPVSRETHELLEDGFSLYDEDELWRMVARLLMNYIIALHTKLNIK